jgi:hypothetical protein
MTGKSTGKPVGAPRTISPSPDQCRALGEEYIAWLRKNPDAVHHTEWYSIHKMMLRSEWETLVDRQEFVPYYQTARNIFAARHMKGAVKEGIAHRFLRLYLPDLVKAENEQKAYESSLRVQEHIAATPQDKENFDALMKQFNELQEALKSSRIKSKTDSKS